MKVPFTNYNYASNVSVVARYPIVLKFDRTSFGTSMGIKIGINEGEERRGSIIKSRDFQKLVPLSRNKLRVLLPFLEKGARIWRNANSF